MQAAKQIFLLSGKKKKKKTFQKREREKRLFPEKDFLVTQYAKAFCNFHSIAHPISNYCNLAAG